MSCLGQTIAPPGNRATVNALKVPQPLALDELKKKLRRSKGQAERNASEPPEDPLQVPTAPNDDLRDRKRPQMTIF